MEAENPTLSSSNTDNGVSFVQFAEKKWRLVEKCGASTTEATNFLTFRVLDLFIKRLRKDSMPARKSGCAYDEKAKKVKVVLKKAKIKKKKKMVKTARKKTKKKEGIFDFEKEGLEPPPTISTRLERRIEEKGGIDVKLVVMKQITYTDLSKHHGRLSIPVKMVRSKLHDYFLTEEEERSVSKNGKMNVMLIEPCGEENKMVFTRWRVGSSTYSYMLMANWNDVVERNHDNNKFFKVNDVIQVWSFRVGAQLWFAIEKIWDAPSSSSS